MHRISSIYATTRFPNIFLENWKFLEIWHRIDNAFSFNQATLG